MISSFMILSARSSYILGLLVSAVLVQACIHVEPPSEPRSGEKVYVVEEGDTLSSIAEELSLPWQGLAVRNDIKNPNSLSVGQSLVIPRRVPEKKQSKAVARSDASSRGGFLFGGGQFYWPVKGKISSPFGRRNGRPHHGVDIRAPRGREIRAAKAGRVSFAGWQRGYGKTVIIQHDNGISTLYAHMSRIKVSKKQWVDPSHTIGTVGTTGRTTGPHLHFEVRKGNRAVNPINFYQAGL